LRLSSAVLIQKIGWNYNKISPLFGGLVVNDVNISERGKKLQNETIEKKEEGAPCGLCVSSPIVFDEFIFRLHFLFFKNRWRRRFFFPLMLINSCVLMTTTGFVSVFPLYLGQQFFLHFLVKCI
jgi:hypothetical protein